MGTIPEEKQKQIIDAWDKPLRMPVAVPKPESTKKKRGPKGKATT